MFILSLVCNVIVKFAQHTFARVLIWLAAIATPLQGLSAPACGCTTDASVAIGDAEPASSCCSETAPGVCPCTSAKVCHCEEKGQAKSSCCSQAADDDARVQQHSCCQPRSSCNGRSCCCGGLGDANGSGCSCGDNCHCCENDSPAQPATPPVEDSQPDRGVAAASLPAAISEAVTPASQQFSITPAELDASLSGVDRCVSLCRFRL